MRYKLALAFGLIFAIVAADRVYQLVQRQRRHRASEQIRERMDKLRGEMRTIERRLNESGLPTLTPKGAPTRSTLDELRKRSAALHRQRMLVDLVLLLLSTALAVVCVVYWRRRRGSAPRTTPSDHTPR